MFSSHLPIERLERVALLIGRAKLTVANIASLVVLLTIALNVVARYAFRIPIAWAEDVTSIAFAWFIFIGAAAVHDRRGHIGVDLLTGLLPERLREVLDWLGDLFIFIFCLYATYLCCWQTLVSHSTSATTVLEIPLSALFASLAIGFALMALTSALHLIGVNTAPDSL